MNVEQLFTNFPQLGGGGRAAVDPRTAFALGVYRSAQQEAVANFVARGFQPAGKGGRSVKLSTDIGAVCAFTDDAHISPPAGNQLQGVHQN